MPSPRYVLASKNRKKLAELELQLGNKYHLVSQESLGIDEVAETGLSFVENAIIKARHASRLSGLPAIADDSGLEVDCLNGAPGIYSARYAGDGASDKENYQKLLNALKNVEDEQRIARFQCVIVLMRHAQDPVPVICQGSWEGRILREPMGDNGFGYDPVFYVPTHNCSAAQLPQHIKNTISHRACATALLLNRLS